MFADVHQHLWTEQLLGALAARDALPFVRHSNGLTVLYCAGEQPYVIDPTHAAAPLARGGGVDHALVALSSPVGIEALPRESALELIEAHLDGLAEFDAELGAWGPLPLDPPDPDDVDHVLERGCIGISVPAGALAGPHALDSLGPVLERVAAREAPLFVHPGPAPGRLPGAALLDEPLWWKALTDYVAQMHAAWLTFAALGRREHPDLVVVFAMLAGGAPLMSERLATRGGPPVELRDPNIFYDTSSYGPAAIEAVACEVGFDQLLYGSDRPVVRPIVTPHDRLLQRNAARLLETVGAPV